MTQFPPQVSTQMLQVPISALLVTREVYFNFPRWQRKSVWKTVKKRRLIQTILHGGFIHSIVCFRDKTLGNRKLWVIDGRQRLTSIFAFINNEFSTGAPKNGEEYLEPNRFYKDMSAAAQAQIMAFALGISVLDETNEMQLRRYYRDVQNLTQLTSSEIAFSYVSMAADLAQVLMEHSFFGTIYTGLTEHLETFTMAMYPIIIELYGGLTHLDTARVQKVAGGFRDGELVGKEAAFLSNIEERLAMAEHLFTGVQTDTMASAILMYETVYLLLDCGYDPFACEAGLLAEWFTHLDVPISFSQAKAYRASIFGQFVKLSFQRDFWQTQLRVVTTIPGLQARIDPARSAAQVERITSWLYHNHHCPLCHHSISYAELSMHAFRLGESCGAGAPPDEPAQDEAVEEAPEAVIIA